MRTVSGRTNRVVVVGAGLAGLATALHLAGAGRQVTVVEREDRPGGRAGLWEHHGYRVDTGPTVLTMPDVLDEALAAVGDSVADRLELIALRPAYRACFADGSQLDVHTDADAMEAEIRRFAGADDAAGYRRLRRWLTELYQAQYRSFIDRNMDSPLDLVGRDLIRLAALGGFGRLGPKIARFLGDPRLQRVFSFQALYAGLDPRSALALYGVISYMDTVEGVWFPRGGMHQVPAAMAAAASKAGVEFRYGTEVSRLERSGSRVVAVQTEQGDRLSTDAVVLTPDLPVAYRLLDKKLPHRLRWSPSAVVLHAGTSQSWPNTAHHTISFGSAWNETFTEIIRKGRLMSDPSLLISRPTATDPDLAPPGQHLHYVLAPCPNLATGPLDWQAAGPRYRDELLATLQARGFTGLTGSIEMQRLVTPANWLAQGHAAGTPFSAAHTFAQTGPFRPANLAGGSDNVVLAGCGTTPGVGVPPALISGKLAAQRITG